MEYVEYLRERLPEIEFCFDQRCDAMDTFLRALAMAGNDPVVHMEDDIILTTGFRGKLISVTDTFPGCVVQFFSMRKDDLIIGSRWDRNFIMGQCFYLPRGYSKDILRYSLNWPRRTEHPTGLDLMVNDFLRKRKEPYWLYVPSLVDHRVCKSQIDPRRSSRRQSRTFQQ
jgi:hypothetical protein